MAAPMFFMIASVQYPGYNVVQRGSHLVLAAENPDNPFQLWYKDDSWRFLEDRYGNPAFALINNGSKTALKAISSAPSKVSLGTYDPSEKVLEFLWTFRSGSGILDTKTIRSMALDLNLDLGVGKSLPTSGDGVAVILNTTLVSTTSSTQQWNFVEYVPSAYIIQSAWYTQILVAKVPHKDVTYISASGKFNDELTVVAVNSANKNDDQEVWYRVPARGQEDSNSSFIIISKSNGKALKGSTKRGDKVVVTEFDPLDDNFVWSENRTVSNQTRYVAINLANGDKTLHWHLQEDFEYQNASYYHPLTLRETIPAFTRQIWQFIPFPSS